MRTRSWFITVTVLAAAHFVGEVVYEVYYHGYFSCDERCETLQEAFWSFAFRLAKLFITYAVIVTIIEMIVLGAVTIAKGLFLVSRRVTGKQAKG